jgi:hypothetical protein
MTVEHNFEEPKRTMIQDLLQKNGYFRGKEIEWDDWYCHRISVSFYYFHYCSLVHIYDLVITKTCDTDIK